MAGSGRGALRAAGRITASVPAVAGILLALGLSLGSQLSSRPSPDVAWILYVTGALLEGARLGVGIVENSPPVIFALNLPVVSAAHLAGLSPWTAWVWAVTALAVVMAGWSVGILRRSSWIQRHEAGAVLCLITFLLLLPGPDFGQRDHLTVLLTLPYLALLSLRLSGGGVGTGQAVLAGAVAALGIGIKPHFALLPIGMVALLWRVRGGRAVVLPEHLAIGVVGSLYLVAVAVVVPDYFGYARTYGALYQHLLVLTPWLLLQISQGIMPAMVALGSFLALRGRLPDSIAAAADVLAVATAAFLLAALLQAKGWRYQFYPSMALGLTLAALLAWGTSWRDVPVVRRLYTVLSAATVGLSAITASASALSRIGAPRSPRFDADPSLVELLPLVRTVPQGEAVVVLSTNIASGFPLVLDGGGRWGLRFPSLWPLAAFYHEQLSRGGLVAPRPLPLRPELERAYGRAVVADMASSRPALILVLSPFPGIQPSDSVPDVRRGPVVGGEARRFDYLAYFAPVEGMADLLSRYRMAGNAGMYRVLWRADLPRRGGLPEGTARP